MDCPCPDHLADFIFVWPSRFQVGKNFVLGDRFPNFFVPLAALVAIGFKLDDLGL